MGRSFTVQLEEVLQRQFTNDIEWRLASHYDDDDDNVLPVYSAACLQWSAAGISNSSRVEFMLKMLVNVNEDVN